MRDRRDSNSDTLREAEVSSSSRKLPIGHVTDSHKTSTLLPSDFLGTPSRLTPLLDLLQWRQGTIALPSERNEKVKIKEAWGRISDAGGRDAGTFKEAILGLIAHKDEKQTFAATLQEETCGETRWRAVALQQQHGLVVLRELNAALLEENAWLREHILCLKRDLQAKRYESRRSSSWESPVPEHSDKLEGTTHVNQMKKSPKRMAKPLCRFNFDRQKGHTTGSSQAEKVELRCGIPNEASPNGRFVKGKLSQTSRPLGGGLCNALACTCLHCGHLLPCHFHKDVDTSLAAADVGSVCRSCLCNIQSAVLQRSHRGSSGSSAPTELPTEGSDVSAYSKVQFSAKQEEGTLTVERSTCGVCGRENVFAGCTEPKMSDATVECHSRREDPQWLLISKEALEERLECQSCPRFLSMAHEWARCAAVLESYRLKDLEEIAYLEMRVDWMRNDVTTCGSCATPPAELSAEQTLRSQCPVRSTVLGSGEDEKKCLSLESLSISRPLTAAGLLGQDSDSIESLLRTPTPCNDVLHSAKSCQGY